MRVGSRPLTTPMRTLKLWQPPPSDYIKINVSIVFVDCMSVASVRVVARNSLSVVLIFLWDYIGLCTSLDEPELRVCLVGLYIAITLNNHVIL